MGVAEAWRPVPKVFFLLEFVPICGDTGDAWSTNQQWRWDSGRFFCGGGQRKLRTGGRGRRKGFDYLPQSRSPENAYRMYILKT
jgi:hypothetical protein